MGNMAIKQAALRSSLRGQLAVAAIVLAFSGAAAGDQPSGQTMQAGMGDKTANLLWLKPNDAKPCPAGMTPVTNAQGAVATVNGKTKCVAATQADHH
jgi:hypothetical protein